MITSSNLGQRIESLAREFYDIKKQLESNASVRKLLAGKELKRGLPKKVEVLLPRYREVVDGLYQSNITPDRSLLEKLENYSSTGMNKESNSYVASVEEDCIILGDISCVDHLGNVFEHYDRLRVDKDIARNADGSQMNFNPYEAITHFEKEGKFVPCFALSCNIIDCFHDNRQDKEINRSLLQYKDKRNGTGWHAQNTVVTALSIIHYPLDYDFPKPWQGGNIIRKRARKVFSFTLDKGIGNSSVGDALKNANTTNYIKDLTGMQHPKKLIEVGEYFGKTAWFWSPNSRRICAGWLGCGSYSFIIDSSGYLGSDDAACGVRESQREKNLHRKRRSISLR